MAEGDCGSFSLRLDCQNRRYFAVEIDICSVIWRMVVELEGTIINRVEWPGEHRHSDTTMRAAITPVKNNEEGTEDIEGAPMHRGLLKARKEKKNDILASQVVAAFHFDISSALARSS